MQNPLASKPLPQSLTSVAAVADRYDGFIFDIWGVVHDGVHAYPGAIETIRSLHARGKRVVFLSNSPQAPINIRRALAGFGLVAGDYDDVVSSGLLTRQALTQRDDDFLRACGNACWHLGHRGTHRSVYDGLDLQFVDRPEEASFVLATGHRQDFESLADYEADLQACLAHGLPLICANPDRVVIQGGRESLCPGAVAERYAEMGGATRLYGKPYRVAFDTALAALDVPRDRALMVGDSLHTDMGGAQAAGIDGLWLLGGVHLRDLGGVWGAPVAPEAMQRVLALSDVVPRYCMAGLVP